MLYDLLVVKVYVKLLEDCESDALWFVSWKYIMLWLLKDYNIVIEGLLCDMLVKVQNKWKSIDLQFK